MKFIYTGEAPKGSIEQYGHTFAPDVPTEVTDQETVAKLLAHPHFKKVVAARAAVPEPEPEEQEPNTKPRRKRGDSGTSGGSG